MDWAAKEGLSPDVRPAEPERASEWPSSAPARPGWPPAYDLARKGFRPTIFEALPVAGGMLGAAIPSTACPEEDPGRRDRDYQEGRRRDQDRRQAGQGLHDRRRCSQEGFKAVFIATGRMEVDEDGHPGGGRRRASSSRSNTSRPSTSAGDIGRRPERGRRRRRELGHRRRPRRHPRQALRKGDHPLPSDEGRDAGLSGRGRRRPSKKAWRSSSSSRRSRS